MKIVALIILFALTWHVTSYTTRSILEAVKQNSYSVKWPFVQRKLRVFYVVYVVDGETRSKTLESSSQIMDLATLNRTRRFLAQHHDCDSTEIEVTNVINLGLKPE